MAIAAEAADRIATCLSLLHRADRRLKQWLVTHRRVRHEFTFDAANPDLPRFSEYLATNGLIREKTPPYHQIPELGFGVNLQLQSRSRIFASASFRIGATHHHSSNNAYLDVRQCRCSHTRMLEILVEAFWPTAGFVAAHRFYDDNQVLRRAWACFGEVKPSESSAGLVPRRTQAGPIHSVPINRIGSPDSSFSVSGH